jgi:hypothetical protein
VDLKWKIELMFVCYLCPSWSWAPNLVPWYYTQYYSHTTLPTLTSSTLPSYANKKRTYKNLWVINHIQHSWKELLKWTFCTSKTSELDFDEDKIWNNIQNWSWFLYQAHLSILCGVLNLWELCRLHHWIQPILWFLELDLWAKRAMLYIFYKFTKFYGFHRNWEEFCGFN